MSKQINYVGVVRDRLGSLATRYSKRYASYYEAHVAAERLARRHFTGERSDVGVVAIS